MISIDNLRLQLPAGFENRAHDIVQLVGQSLADTPVTSNGQLAQLSLPPMVLQGHESNHQIAHQIASSISGQLNNTSKSGAAHGR